MLEDQGVNQSDFVTAEVSRVLDAASLAHLGIIATLISAVGFGVAAESGSGWLGLLAAVLVAAAWLAVCKVRALRNRIVLVMRWLAEP
jgi:hypothetical protein